MDGFGMSFLTAVTFFVMRQNLFLWLYKIWFSPHPSCLLPSGCLFPQFLLEDRVVLCCGVFCPPLGMTWLLLSWSRCGYPQETPQDGPMNIAWRSLGEWPETPQRRKLFPCALSQAVCYSSLCHIPQRCQGMYKTEGKMTRESVCTVLINCHQCWKWRGLFSDTHPVTHAFVIHLWSTKMDFSGIIAASLPEKQRKVHSRLVEMTYT